MLESFYNLRNPLLPAACHMPDCEARVFSDGRLYLYGSWDEAEDHYCSNQYYVASTADLQEWTVHGPSFSTNDVPWLTDAQRRDTYLYAPDAVEWNGRYYLFFCLSDESEGVAVSDCPTGPFKDAVRLPASGIDPAVLLDKDGQVYYYWGQYAAKAARLTSDLRGICEETRVHGIVTERQHAFHEGSSLRKRGDLYYYVFADISRGKPTCLGYATSTSPLGPFTYRGIIIDNAGCDPKTWNNHGSIEEVFGKWYVFYHRASHNCKTMRRVCVEPITFREDGGIDEVIMTSQGAGPPFGPEEWMPAYTACGLQGKAYISEANGKECVVNLHSGDCAVFRYLHSERPITEFRLDCEGVELVAIYLDDTFFGQGADLISGSIPPGKYTLKLEFQSAKDGIFNGVKFR